jgi:hypothetical protein
MFKVQLDLRWDKVTITCSDMLWKSCSAGVKVKYNRVQSFNFGVVTVTKADMDAAMKLVNKNTPDIFITRRCNELQFYIDGKNVLLPYCEGIKEDHLFKVVGGNSFTTGDWNLKKALSLVIDSCSTDETRPAMNCVHFSFFKENVCEVAATDSYRLSMTRMWAQHIHPAIGNYKKGLLVYAKTLWPLMRTDSDIGRSTSVLVGSKNVSVQVNDAFFTPVGRFDVVINGPICKEPFIDYRRQDSIPATREGDKVIKYRFHYPAKIVAQTIREFGKKLSEKNNRMLFEIAPNKSMMKIFGISKQHCDQKSFKEPLPETAPEDELNLMEPVSDITIRGAYNYKFFADVIEQAESGADISL